MKRSGLLELKLIKFFVTVNTNRSPQRIFQENGKGWQTLNSQNSLWARLNNQVALKGRERLQIFDPLSQDAAYTAQATKFVTVHEF